MARLLGEQRCQYCGRRALQILVVRESEPDRRALQAAPTALPDCRVFLAEDGFEGLIRIGQRAPRC